MIFLTCLFIGVGLASAQTKTVRGTVTSADDGLPIVGASIVVDGTTQGTVTDLDGNFVIDNVQAKSKTITVSYIGMRTQRFQIKPGIMKIQLKADTELLDEVMVVAYGTAKKSSFTGSASVIDNKKMELRPVTNLTKSLDGQSTGVIATSGSGQPGSGASIVIRGFGSINASNSPLYVVDGVPFDGNINSINPSDIESTTILKDASASALYGARGANGVVMITTKKGREGKPTVSYRGSVGWSWRAQKKYDMVDQREFISLSYEALKNGYMFDNGMPSEKAAIFANNDLGKLLGGKVNPQVFNPFKNYTWDNIIDPATGLVHADAVSAYKGDWLDAVTRNGAMRHEHQLQVQGGTKKTQYMFSLSYMNEDGVLKTTSFDRYTGRANIDTKINDFIQTGVNLSLASSKSNFSDFEGTQASNPWYTAQFIAPIYNVYILDAEGNPVLDENGNKQLDYGEVDGTGRPENEDFNPLGGLLDDKADNIADNASLRTNFVLGTDKETAGWLQGLKLNMSFGCDYRAINSMSYYNMFHGNQKGSGLIYRTSTRNRSYTFNQLLTWNRNFGDHHIDLLGGHEFYAMQYKYLTASKGNLIPGIYELRPGASLKGADSYTDNYRIDSWLGRLNYDFADKYYLSASLRTDGSSRFHKDERWGTFWSLGANWRMSEEKFIKDIEWIDNLSLHISYGEQGNDNLGSYYAWQSLWGVEYPNANQSGVSINSLETKNLTWEKSQNFNVGIEGAFFDNRLRASVEFFNKKTTDMLLSYPKATSTGFDGYNANVGDLRNRGLEFNIDGTIIDQQNFRWNARFMGSVIDNKVLKLTQESPQIVLGSTVIEVGKELNTFYLPKSAGVDPSTGAQLYYAYKDAKGNEVPEYITSDKNLANNSKYYQGSRIPDLYGSVGTDFTFFNRLNLSILTTYSIGGKVFDGVYAGLMDVMYPRKMWHKHELRRWRQPGDITDVPRVEIGGSNAMTDRYLIDASYFAIKNITLSYALPNVWAQKVGLKNARMYGSVDNVAMFSHLDGMDPQYNFSGSTGFDYAPVRTFSIGLELKF